MLKLLRATPPAIGLDVGSESVKLLQLAAGSNGLAVTAALCVAIPDGVKGDPDRRVAFAGDIVRDALNGRRFRGRRLVAALPKELVHYKTHRLPSMSADELQMAGRIDARDLFRFDPDSADVRCIDAGEVRAGRDHRQEIILVAAGKRYVNDFVWSLHRAGAVVAALDIEPCALWRSAAAICTRGRPVPCMLLDLGAAQSRVVIGCVGGLRVARTIDVGTDHFRTAISRKLGLPLAEVEQLRRRARANGNDKLDGVRRVLNDTTRHSVELLAREVQACVRYHAQTFRGPGPGRIELVGGDAGNPHVRSVLEATLCIPAEPLDVFRGIDTTAIPTSHRTESLGEWAVSLGSALRGLPAGDVCRSSSVSTTPASAGSAAEETHGVTVDAAVGVGRE